MYTLLWTYLAIGCTALGGRSTGDLLSLEITPSEATLSTSALVPQTLDFQVAATFESGFVDDDFDLVSWSQSNSTAGVLSQEGNFTTSVTNGGRTLITVDNSGITATADLTVIYEEAVEDDGLPEGATEAFDGEATDSGGQLGWTYPESGVALPRNLPEMTFMWDDALGVELYQLEFSSSTTSVRATTEDTLWTAPTALWQVITATNAGDEVTVSLKGAEISTANGAVEYVNGLYDGGTITFRVNRFDAFGALYYWSTEREGVVRTDVSEVSPEPWFGENQGSDYCVGCHVISDDGSRMAYTAKVSESETDLRLGIAELDEDAEITPLLEMGTERDYGWFSTFDPTGTYLVVSYMGVLSVYDGQTGAFSHEIASDLVLTKPHWSADNTMLIAVSAKGFEHDQQFEGADIVVFDHLGEGQFGEPWVLVPDPGDHNQYYPMFSPDSKWVAFNRSTGFSSFDIDAQLWLVNAEGGEPIYLANANMDGYTLNSWPRWGPIPDDDVLWLAFASTRHYGNLSRDYSSHVWVTAIDTYIAEDGLDPSYPAYWMVQQEVGTSNHAPWWSLY